MNMSVLFCGSDFAFGRKAAGNVDYLKKEAEKGDFSLHVIQKEAFDSVEAGSTAIRKMLTDGEIEEANRLLGYSYQIDGIVAHGNHLGTGFGFPTANIYPEQDKMFPHFGVYACKVRIGRRIYRAMVNVGVKPTIEGEYEPLIEANLFDFSGDIYGRPITVYFMKFIRPEMKFGSFQELIDQMTRDKDTCIRYFKKKK